MANAVRKSVRTVFVLMMTPRLSFFYGGMVGKRNVISTILQSFIAMGAISILWVVFGFSLRKNDAHLPANVPFVILGAAMLWLGWFGFNGGSSLAADGTAIKAFLNTNTSGAIFASSGLIAWTHAGFIEFLASIVGVAIVIVYTFVMSMVLYWLTNKMIPMRVSEKNESLGLDASQHDETYGLSGDEEREIEEYFLHGA